MTVSSSSTVGYDSFRNKGMDFIYVRNKNVYSLKHLIQSLLNGAV